MKKMINSNIISTILIILILSNFLIFLVPNNVQAATYNQVTINANGNNNNGISAFPASYQEVLKKLVNDTGHKNWKFKAFYTDIDWTELTSGNNENKCLRNTIINSSPSSWKCTCGRGGDYGYVCASGAIVNYYLDPRNFLSETTIFQFLDLSNSSPASLDQIKKAVSGTYLAGSVNGESYAQIIYDAAKESGENALSIIVKIFQELGKGTSLPGMISGNNSQYPGVYNFFNYGASDGAGNIARGLDYAKRAGWTTPRKALIEGAKLISDSYIKAGQNTKYTFKFDIINDSGTGMYWHQYATNVQDPSGQAKLLFDKYLNNGWLNNELTFIIPVYKNMPAYVKLPSKLTTSSGTLYYISSNYSDVTLRSQPSANSAQKTMLRRNTPVVMLAYNCNNGWSKVKLEDGTEGYVSNAYLTKVNTSKDTYKVPSQPSSTPNNNNSNNNNNNSTKFEEGKNFKLDGDYLLVESGTKLSDVKAKQKVTACTKDGKEVANDTKMATGTSIKINDKIYTTVMFGDLTKDGKLDTADLLKLQKHLLKITPITDQKLIKAIDLNKDSKLDTADLLKLQKHLLKIACVKMP